MTKRGWLTLVVLVAVFAAGYVTGRHQRPVPDPHLLATADRIQSTIGWGKEQLAEAAATRHRAASARDYAQAHRSAHHEDSPLPPLAPSAAASASDTVRYLTRRVDYLLTLNGNLQRDTLRLGMVADSALAAADSFELAAIKADTTADSLLVVLDSAQVDLRTAADSMGRLNARVKSLERKAFGTHLGAGVAFSAVKQTFTAVAGLSVRTSKKLLFLEVDARAIGGWGIGGDGTEMRAGPGGAAQVTVTF